MNTFSKLARKTELSLKTAVYGHHFCSLTNNAINSLSESRWRSDISKHLTHYSAIHSCECFDFSNNNEKLHYPEWVKLRYLMNERIVAGIRKATVFPKSGAIITPTKQALIETLGSLHKALHYSGFKEEVVTNRWRVKKSGLNVIVPGTSGFYHWFLESIPGILRCLSIFPNHSILLPQTRASFVDQSLEIIFGQDWIKHVVFSDRPLEVNEAVFYSKAQGAQFVHPADVLHVREHILKNIDLDKFPKKRRIYISRRKATARACDESSVIADFQDYGYDIVELERMELRDQITLVATADHIAGYHGAGFTHGIFSHKRANFLELFQYHRRNDCYARLLTSMARKYSLVVSQKEDPGKFKSLRELLPR